MKYIWKVNIRVNIYLLYKRVVIYWGVKYIHIYISHHSLIHNFFGKESKKWSKGIAVNRIFFVQFIGSKSFGLRFLTATLVNTCEDNKTEHMNLCMMINDILK